MTEPLTNMPIVKRIRLLRRWFFRFKKEVTCAFFRLWLNDIHGKERIPKEGPVIIICNHTSYYDWILLTAIYPKKYIVFVGNQAITSRPIVNWFMQWNILIYIATDSPGVKFFKEIMRKLKEGKIVVMFPEGARSRDGIMKKPKSGFVKLAFKSKVPIVPFGIKGAYDVLPPGKKIPRLKKCDIYVGEEINVEKLINANGEKDKVKHLSREKQDEVAETIMRKVAKMINQKTEF